MSAISIETKKISELLEALASQCSDDDLMVIRLANGTGTKSIKLSELKALFNVAGGIAYDHSESGLAAEDVQAALDEIGTPLSGSGAGFHNMIYRGKNLGTAYTSQQKAKIQDGSFDDLFIGDYWTINGTVYRIADFDYWLNTGDTNCTNHHAVIVPDTCLYNAQMHNTASGQYDASDNPTTGAYVGSDMYITNLATAKSKIKTDFGSANILSHREYFANAVTNGYESAEAWYDSEVDLMNEQMVYGGIVYHNAIHGTNWPTNYTIDKSQLHLFKHRHDLIGIRANFWLRDVANATTFASVDSHGDANAGRSSRPHGVRPAFGIH